MTAKEYLQQIYRITMEIRRIRDHYDTIKYEMFSLSSPSGQTDVRVQTSTSGDSMLRLIAKAEALQKDLKDREEMLLAKRWKICGQIEAMQDERFKVLLFERYVRCLKWEQIAVDMNYSIMHIYRLHGEALASFARKYKDVI